MAVNFKLLSKRINVYRNQWNYPQRCLKETIHFTHVYNSCANNKSEIYNLETFHARLHFAISVIS